VAVVVTGSRIPTPASRRSGGRPPPCGGSVFAALTSVAVLAGATVACGPGDGDPPPPWTEEALPGGGTRVVNTGPGLWGEGAGWRLELEQVLGGSEATGPEAFAGPGAVEMDHEGRIYVLDQVAAELRVFSPDGAHLRTVGRRGEGPGEFSSPNGLLWVADDTLLVVDQQGGRYSFFTRDGEFVRSAPRPLNFFGIFRGGYHEGRVHEFTLLLNEEPWRTAVVRLPVAGGAGGDGPASIRSDTVVLPHIVEDRTFELSDGTTRMLVGVPFTPAPVVHVDGQGGIWHGFGGEFQITHADSHGETLREVILHDDPAPVTDADIELWMSEPGIGRFLEMGGQVDRSRIPERKPHFHGLHLDPGGYLWVQVPGAAGEAAFVLFDPEGRFLGRIGLEGVDRPPYMPPVVVRNDRLLLLALDGFQASELRIYRIHR
jgi:hypothetical protein